jgi:hypothetical protein
MAAFGSRAMQLFQQSRLRSGTARSGQHRLVTDVLGSHGLPLVPTDQIAGFGEEVQRRRPFNDVAFDLVGQDF